MNDRNLIIGVLGLLLVIGVVLYAVSDKPGNGGTNGGVTVTASSSPVAAFAQCLTDNGAIFYGAFWCPHCQSQKRLFGEADALLKYVECSMPDGNSQTLFCQSKGIQSYPTWEFADGSRVTGEQSFAALTEKVPQCPAPAAQ